MRIKLACLMCLIVTLTGCGISNKEIAEYKRLKSIQDSMANEYDEEKYTKIIEDIINYSQYDDTTKDTVREIYSNDVTEYVFKKIDKINNGQSVMTVGEEVSTKYIPDNTEVNGEYYKYDSEFNIIGTCTEDEHYESLKEFYGNELNKVERFEICRDAIIVSIANKYNGRYNIRFKVEKAVISDIEIFKARG